MNDENIKQTKSAQRPRDIWGSAAVRYKEGMIATMNSFGTYGGDVTTIKMSPEEFQLYCRKRGL